MHTYICYFFRFLIIQNIFSDRCATDVFRTFRDDWDAEINKYFHHINEINDPVLRNISIYFLQYYIDGYYYYKNSDKVHRSAACQYLNRWLRGQKDLFTYGEHCETRVYLWKNNIESLWDMIKNEYTVADYKNKQEPWCTKSPLIQKTKYPQELTPLDCKKSISQEPPNRDSPPPTVQTESICPPCPNLLISPQTDQPPQTDEPPEKDSTKNLAVTSGFTAVGTLGTLFFLYRFTPMASWFRRPGMNHVGTDLYMNSGAENFLGMQHGNDSNNLFYQPQV